MTGSAASLVGSRWRRSAVFRNLGWRALIGPALLWLGVFYLYPLGVMLLRSVSDFREPQVSGLDNFAWFFTNPTNITVLTRTIWTAFYVCVICLVIGYPYAYLMTLSKGWVRAVMLGSVIVPWATSALVRNFAWIGILNINGPINGLLSALGLGRHQLVGNLIGVTIGMAHVQLPLMVLPLFATLTRIDRRLLDAAMSLGAKPRLAFVRVYLPLSLPGVVAGSVLVFVNSLGFYLTPALLGSPQQSLLSTLMVTQVRQVLAWGRAGAMAVVLVVTTVTLLGLSGLIVRRMGSYARKRRA